MQKITGYQTILKQFSGITGSYLPRKVIGCGPYLYSNLQ
jgi:hypothetical protein